MGRDIEAVETAKQSKNREMGFERVKLDFKNLMTHTQTYILYVPESLVFSIINERLLRCCAAMNL